MPYLKVIFKINGGPGWDWTSDTQIFSLVLYQLSYRTILFGAGSRTWTCTRLAHWFLRPACLPFHHSRIRWLPRLDSNQGNVRVKVWCLTAWLRSNMVELTGIEPVSTNNPKLQISFLPYKFCPFSFDPLTIPPWKISSVVLLLKSILL